jgi:DNA polymerase-3 subunit delta
VAKLSEETLKKHIKEQSFLPVYVLYGEEQYLIGRYVSQITDATVGDCMPDFNLARLSGEGLTLSQLLASAEVLPVMHSHRCILVQDFSPKEQEDSALKEWAAYLADPCPGNVIIFYYTTLRPAAVGKWKTFLSACEKHGGVLKLDKKTEQDLVKILCSGAGKRGCRMTASTASYLIGCVGNDMNTLLRELEKLCAYKLNQEVTDRDVDLLCTKTLTATAFQMVQKINRKDSVGALNILQNLFQMREEPIKIMGALASSYVNLYRALTAQEASIPLGEFGKELGMKNPNNLQYSLRDARTLGGKRLDESLRLLSESDKKLKSLPVDGKIILEQTVVELLRIAGGCHA